MDTAKSTKQTLTAAMLSALAVAMGQALAGIPNVELITTIVFIAGFILGASWGVVVGAVSMLVHSLFNPMGAAAPPVLVAQCVGMAAAGLAGAWLGTTAVRQRVVFAAVALGVVGAVVTLLFQVLVNLGGFYAFAGERSMAELGKWIWGGLTFTALHLLWNTGVFAVAMPGMLRVLNRYRLVTIAVAMLLVANPSLSRAQSVPIDSLAVADSTLAADSAATDAASRPRVNAFERNQFPLSNSHSFSLDHYFERSAGVLVSRLGPIGFDPRLSRFGIGTGRAVFRLDGIDLNNPHSGLAPLIQFPVSRIGHLEPSSVGGNAEGLFEARSSLPHVDLPATRFDLATGTNGQTHRRVGFSSADGPVGLDLYYDEVLTDGYQFIPDLLITDNGRSNARNIGGGIRGQLETGVAYGANFQRFVSTSSSGDEARRNGTIASASIGVGEVGRFGDGESGARVTAFQRIYESTFPDSTTESQSTGVAARWQPAAVGGLALSLRAEEIDGTEALADTSVQRKVNRYSTDLRYRLKPKWGGASAWVGVDGQDDRTAPVGFGGEATLRLWQLDSGSAAATVRGGRRTRLPTLSEMFTPLHSLANGNTLSGNAQLDAEAVTEVGGNARVSWRGIQIGVDISQLEVADPIIITGDTSGARTFGNGASESHTVVTPELRLDARVLGFSIQSENRVALASGDQTPYFRRVPETHAQCRLRIERNLFERTSGFALTGELTYASERVDHFGSAVPSHQVWNLFFDWRLLEADMYLALFNAFDENYVTVGDALMMPRTFAYGIVWTLFN